MPLTLTHDHWAALERTVAQYKTCKVILHLHEGCVRRISVEHGVVCEAEECSGTGSDGVAYALQKQQA